MKNGPYILVVAPENFPGKKYRGRYCYQHHLVWWTHNGTVPAAGEIIHHKDGDKHNNEISNLELMDGRKHNHLHRQPRIMVKFRCPWCGKEFWRRRRAVLPKYREHAYCSRACVGHSSTCKDKSFIEGDYKSYIIETKKVLAP